MKKFLFLTLIFSAIVSTSVNAQTATDQTIMLQQMKEKIRPQMVKETGLTDAQADRVIEINFEIRMQAATVLRDLNEADRSAKVAELKALKEKKYSEIPLTAEQIKAVYAFYDAPQKKGN